MRYRTVTGLCLAIATLFAVAPSAMLAGEAKGEGTKLYTEYRAVFAKAKAIEDILPYMAKERVAQVEATPKEERAKMFEMVKMMEVKDVKVTKETKTEKGFTLDVTGTGGLGGGPSTGTITLVREDGKLKIEKESWKN
jgi:hypothetical protein